MSNNKAINRYNSDFILISVSIFFSIVFFYFSYKESQNIYLYDDTLQYYYAFLNIRSNPFPYGVEIITPIYMQIVSFLGLSFYQFIFICYLSWLPILIWFIYQAKKRPLLIFVPLFFLTHFFYDNAAFLVRQYLSCVFFFIYVYLHNKNSNYKYCFFIISFFTHISSVILFLIYYLVNFLFFRLNVSIRVCSIVISFIVTLSLLSGIDLSQVIIKIILSNMDKINLDDLMRKALYYNSDDLSSSTNINVLILIVAQFYLVTLLLIFNKISNIKVLKALLFFYVNIFLFLMLRNTVVLSTRVGFLSFYFVIPSFIIILSFFSITKFDGKVKICINAN